MPRRETPIPADAFPPLAFLAQRLRDERAAAGLTYRELSLKAHYSIGVLSEAASGDKAPSWPVTWAYVQACGVHKNREALWQNYWTWAVEWHRPGPAGGTGEGPADPDRPIRTRPPSMLILGDPGTIHALPELARELRALRASSEIPLKQLRHITGLSRSTLSDAFAGKHLPRWQTVERILSLAQLPALEQRRWADAWERVSIAHDRRHTITASPRIIAQQATAPDDKPDAVHRPASLQPPSG